MPQKDEFMTFPNVGGSFKNADRAIGHATIEPDGSVRATITDPEIAEIIRRSEMRAVSIGEGSPRDVTDEMSDRVTAWQAACELVGPLVDAHGLVDQPLETFPELSPTIKSTASAAEQHLEMVLRVADWLLER